jgi:hypothetical protein
MIGGALRRIVTFKSKPQFWLLRFTTYWCVTTDGYFQVKAVILAVTFYYLVVRYDGWLLSSQSSNFGRLTHPTVY